MDEAQRQALLRLARESIESHLAGRPLPPAAPRAEPEAFGGAFVTLKNAGRLRGCIGRFDPDTGLAETVQRMALSALGDPRFQDIPVTAEEMPRIDIEISVLSPMERTGDPLSLQPGVHGIYIRRGYRSGCFLPQVASEQGWNAEQFLSRCCASKAGLPPDAWRDPETEVCLFTAEVFGEK
jgi:AmmeMemoRadiSam system protein A